MYEKDTESQKPSPFQGKSRVYEKDCKDNTVEKDNTTIAVITEEWSFNLLKEKLKNSKRRIDNIIWLYITYKDIKFENKDQFSAQYPRLAKEAKQLTGYSDLRIKNTFEYCEEQAKGRYEWKLSTVIKSIDIC